MTRYIDASKIKFTGDSFNDENGDALVSLSDVRRAIEQTPTADVVEIETIKAWLYEMAINNVGCILEGDFSTACEQIISRLDGLRTFERERKEQG